MSNRERSLFDKEIERLKESNAKLKEENHSLLRECEKTNSAFAMTKAELDSLRKLYESRLFDYAEKIEELVEAKRFYENASKELKETMSSYRHEVDRLLKEIRETRKVV